MGSRGVSRRRLAGILLSLAVSLALAVRPSPTARSFLRFIIDLGLRWKPSPTDGREARLLKYVMNNTAPGDPLAAIAAADEYSYNHEFFFAVGDVKGKILQQALRNMSRPPTTLLELGTYCGYGAMTIASALAPNSFKLFTVETVKRNADVARQMLKHAGLAEDVQVLFGPLKDHVTALQQRGVLLDFVFLDHHKDWYLPDLQLLLNASLLHSGTVVVADNIRFPGAPEYYQFMQQSRQFTTVWHKTLLEYSVWGLPDIMGVSVVV